FELPRGWGWCYLNGVGNWGAGATPNRSNSKYYDGNIPWFKSGELSSDFISESEEKVTELALKQC
ncbi:restriction endonuclease subunit S, partial [Providencia rettgeri]